MQKRNALNSPRLEELKRKKRKIFKNKILIFAFLFLILFIGLVFLSKWQKINIENVEIRGNKVIDTEAIEGIARADIAGHYVWLFPKTNFLIYPKNKIKTDLATEYKRLSDISINVKDFKTLEIAVSEYEGKYTWCGDALSSETPGSNKNCYFLDGQGYAFDEAPYFSGNVYFRFFGNIPRGDEDDPIGYKFSPEKFTDLIALKETLEKMELKPSAFYLNNEGDMKIYFSSEEALPLGPVFLLRSDSDFGKVAENLHAALTTEPLQSDFKQKYSSLLYIDLRFGNKVYYKFND